MPARLDRTDRAILTGAGILLIVLVLATTLLTSTRRSSRAGFPSSYSSAWDGAKAAYLLLEELGYEIERWDLPPTELDGDPEEELLVLASPLQSPTPEEAAALRNFLEQGGHILATGESAVAFLPGAKPFQEGEYVQEDTSFPALVPSPLTRGAESIAMMPPEHWDPGSVEQVTVYGNKETAAVVTYAVGKGRVIWWGSPSPLTNRGIKLPGNLALLLNSVGEKNEREILWDEYFHGARGTLWSYVVKTPLPWVFAQLAFLMMFVLLSHSRRYGAIRVPGKISRLSPLEFVDTLGDLYTTAHAGSAAVRVAQQAFRFQLTRQLGLGSNTTAADLARAAERTLGWEAEPLRGTLVRAERGARSIDLQDAEALEIVQELHDYTARLRTRHAREEAREPG